MANTPSATKKRKNEVPVEDLQKRLVLTGADIVSIGESAELLVGGKNYNTSLISRVQGYGRRNSVQFPRWRSISFSTSARFARPWSVPWSMKPTAR